MRSTGGYVRVHRSLLDWEWYDDDACVRMMIHLLLSVNWEPKDWRGQQVAPGQLITSMDKLAEKLRVSRSAVRRTLDKLKSTGDISIQTNNHWTTITLVNWGEYQEPQTTNGRPKRQQTADHRPTADRPAATTKEEKKERREELYAFAQWWDLYEHKGNRKLASEQWDRLNDDDRAACIAATPAYVKSKPDKQFRKDGERFLRHRAWEDAVVELSVNGNVRRKPITRDEGFALMREIKKANGIPETDGLPPHLMTPELLDLFNR